MRKLAALVVVAGLAYSPQATAGVCWPAPCYPMPCYKVECIPVKCTVMVPRCVDVKKIVHVCVPVPVVVERDVCCVKYMPVECLDCHGCAHVCMRPVSYLKRVSCVVYDCKYEPREVWCKSVVYDQAVVIRHVYRCVPVACPEPMPLVK